MVMSGDRLRDSTNDFDSRLRLFVYREMIRTAQAPFVREIASGLKTTIPKVRASLQRLSANHAFMTQEDGELWRVAPFSAIPTAFPVRVGKRSWFGNCIWDALGIPAMLGKDGDVGASCGCCNVDMRLRVRNGKLLDKDGIIHIAVPARDWYKDVVFT